MIIFIRFVTSRFLLGCFDIDSYCIVKLCSKRMFSLEIDTRRYPTLLPIVVDLCIL